MLSYVLGKMLLPDERLPLPVDSNYIGYINKTYLQYGIQSGHIEKLLITLEAVINGENNELLSGGAMQQIGKIAMAIGFIQGQVSQLILPLYYICKPITRLVYGDDACDGFFVTIGKKPTSPRADDSFLVTLSLFFQCFQSFVVMFFGSIAMMQTDNLSYAVTQFFLAIMITDFSKLKDFSKQRHLKYLTWFLTKVKPVQRTLHLEGKEDIKALQQYTTAAEWVFFGFASIVTKKVAVTTT